MYKLTPNPKYTYNPSFIMKFEDDECTKYDKTVQNIVKTWWGNQNKFKTNSQGI
jgi:hypothetical protein